MWLLRDITLHLGARHAIFQHKKNCRAAFPVLRRERFQVHNKVTQLDSNEPVGPDWSFATPLLRDLDVAVLPVTTRLQDKRRLHPGTAVYTVFLFASMLSRSGNSVRISKCTV